MDIQTILNNAMAADRTENMKSSSQLMLGELILKLEAIKKKSLPIYFDNSKYIPTGLDSWRGNYCELALSYEKDVTTGCYEQPKDTCTKDNYGDHDFQCKCGGTKLHKTSLPKKPTVNDLIKVLKVSLGKYFVGYKGGDFTMGKNTPIWVANYGDSRGFKADEGKDSQAIVDIIENKKRVIIKTECMDY